MHLPIKSISDFCKKGNYHSLPFATTAKQTKETILVPVIF